MKYNKICLVLFHGTLQRPSAWLDFQNLIQSRLADTGVKVEFHTPDLYADNPTELSPWIRKIYKNLPTEAPLIAIGYSLGGRLALLLESQFPKVLSAYISFSGDLGLINSEQLAARKEVDQKWGLRFKTEPWHLLLSDWSKIPYFAGRPNPIAPNEKDFDRHTLGNVWLLTSKSQMPSLESAWKNLGCPSLLLAGEDDKVFIESQKRMALMQTNAKQIVIKNAAHRIPWDNMDPCVEEVYLFIKENFLHDELL